MILNNCTKPFNRDPCWTSLVAQLVKESACDVGDLGSVPELGRSLGEGKGYPLQYSGLENPRDCMSMGLQRVGHDRATFTFTFLRTGLDGRQAFAFQVALSGGRKLLTEGSGFPPHRVACGDSAPRPGIDCNHLPWEHRLHCSAARGVPVDCICPNSLPLSRGSALWSGVWVCVSPELCDFHIFSTLGGLASYPILLHQET